MFGLRTASTSDLAAIQAHINYNQHFLWTIRNAQYPEVDGFMYSPYVSAGQSVELVKSNFL